MTARNPYDELYEGLNKLLKFLESHANTPLENLHIPADIGERLRGIEQRVETFNRLGELIINLSGVEQEELKKRLQGLSNEVSEEGKKLIERGNEIKKTADSLSQIMMGKGKEKPAEKLLPEETPPEEESKPLTPPPIIEERFLTDEQKAKKRRSKFKRFGSDDKWKPL